MITRGTINRRGYCYERAKELRTLNKCGKICTFSFSGDRARNVQYNAPLIVIPCDIGYYTGDVHWLYHSVYVCNDMVYTMELMDAIPFQLYHKMVNSCTLAYYRNLSEEPKLMNNTRGTDFIRSLTKEGKFQVPYCVE